MKKALEIYTEFIKLDSLLKLSGIAVTGGEAKDYIQAGKVSLNGNICSERGKKIRPGDTVSINGENITLVYKEKM